MDTRVLLVGMKIAEIPKALSDEVINTPPWDMVLNRRLYHQASLQDYHICIVNLTYQDLLGLKEVLWGFRDEFDDFFDGGGILIVFSTYPRTSISYVAKVDLGYRIVKDEKNPYSTYEWLPVSLDARDKQGQSVTFSKKTSIGNVLDDSDFIWETVFQIEDPHAVVARNPSGRAVGVELPHSDGYLILLPAFKQEDLPPRLVRKIIDAVKKGYIGEAQPMISRPDWIGTYVLSGEEQAAEKFKVAKAKMEKFESAKALLYMHGKRLTASVRNILEELGYESRDTEDEGRHDIEIEQKGHTGFVEVKGLKRHAGAKDLRQLSDHYSQAREDAEEKGEDVDIKGIFVVNHYREEHPDKRGEPFTGEAERIGKRDQFCLVTTVHLHRMYSDLLSGKLSREEIHERIWRTTGIFAYPDNR